MGEQGASPAPRGSSVSVLSVFEQRLSAFVVAQAPASAVERARLKAFVAVRVGFSAFLLVAAPLWLLSASPLQGWQCAAIAALLLPLCAVFALSRGASFDIAQTVSIAGLVSFAAALSFGGKDNAAISVAVLLLAVLEAAGSKLRHLIAAAGAAVAGATFVVFSGLSAVQGETSPAAHAVLVVLIVGYACALGWAMAYANAIATHGERRETLRHEALAQTIGDLVLRQDRDGSVVHASNEGITLFGLTPRDLMGRGLFERIHVGDRPAFLSTIADAMDSDATASRLVRLRRGGASNDLDEALPEPSFAWIEMRVHRLPQERRARDPHDRAAVVTIVRDVTSSRQAEEDIQAARDHAEQANIWKDRFLANVSHELRTPLNAIIGFAEILANEDVMPTEPARRKEYAQIIHTSGHHLLEVVNSILDVSKIDAGSFDIVTEPFALPPLLDQCCDMMSLKAGQAGVTIARDYPREMDELVADKRACKQVLINLLSNAVKFTRSGGLVTLTAHPEGNSFVIQVADDGIGIAPSDLAHIGDPFFQAHNTTTRAYEGTGLGLSLVRGLVGLHGGSISVESALDQGTVVTVRMPAHCIVAPGRSRLAPIETIVRRGAPAMARNAEVTQVAVKKIA